MLARSGVGLLEAGMGDQPLDVQLTTNAVAKKATGRRCIALFVLFLASGLLVFLPSQFVAYDARRGIQFAVFGGISLFFTGSTLFLYRSDRFKPYWQVSFAYLLAALGLLLGRFFGELPTHWLGLGWNSPKGVALGRLSGAIISAAPVILLVKLFNGRLGLIYLQRGRLKLGIVIGVTSFIVMAILGLMQVRAEGVGAARLLQLAPWVLIFIVANGFSEELFFRGLFLQRYEDFLNRHLSNLVTALVFAIGHMQVSYTPAVLVLVVAALVFGLASGYIMQKTDSLWASTLFHAGTDTLVVFAVFRSAGIKM
jgi:membrane protease YdiL (CAAX protease family)